MFLAVDIGNTNISFGLFKGEKLTKAWDVSASLRGVRLRRTTKQSKDKINACIVSSVVPKLTKTICANIFKTYSIKPEVIGKDIKVPIKSLYFRPKELGQDRLVNAYAARIIYGAPVIVISCGTALTIDVVNESGVHIGGLIQPGLSLMLAALHSKTALLPKIKLAPANGFLGKDAESCIKNGVILGSSASIDGLIEKIRAKIGRNAKIIGTGGDVELIKGNLKHNIKIDKELTLKGIQKVATMYTGLPGQAGQ